MKRRNKVVTAVAVTVAVLAVLLAGASVYMVNYALCPEKEDVAVSEKRMLEEYPQLVPWTDSLRACGALRDTFVTAPDGARLHALYVRAPRPTRRTAVIVHGYTDNAVRMLHIGYLYHAGLGYNILLPDLRHAGLSDGEAIQMGWLDRKDVEQWLGEVPALFGDSVRAVVHGISMGAATTMMVSGDSVPDFVRCYVADCGYTDVWEQFSKELKGQFGLPAFPLLYTAGWVCQARYGWNFKEASALRQVAGCRLPMFFIHGDKDDYVPTWMVYELYDAKPEPKELWVTEGVDHAHSYKMYPEEYTRRVGRFAETWLDR